MLGRSSVPRQCREVRVRCETRVRKAKLSFALSQNNRVGLPKVRKASVAYEAFMVFLAGQRRP